MKKLLLLIFLLVPIHAFAQDCTKGQTVTFAQLPTAYQQGTSCTITDAVTCTKGQVVTVGGGSTTCPLTWFDKQWIASPSASAGPNLSAPGPIGGTTPSTGQFTALGLGGAAPTQPNGIMVAQADTYLAGFPGGYWLIFVAGNLSEIAFGVPVAINNSDNPVRSMARMPLRFDEGREAALAPNESMGTFATVKAMTIENIVLDIKVSPTCTVSEQIACYDCGNAGGACTAGQVSTIMSPITIATGATRQSIIEPINQSSVGASEFISCLIIAGTCTVSDNSIQMMARPQ